tara:strand:+ start:73 stop:369 length:297 start_codon:yes stop_codon:yes gene_type:complete
MINPLYEEKAIQMASRYRDMRDMMPNSGMYREAMYQYQDMARGRDGGSLGFIPEDWTEFAVNSMLPVTTEPTCRNYNYPGYPDSFFSRVLELLGEDHV